MPKLPKEIDLQVISIFENYSVEHFENGHVILKQKWQILLLTTMGMLMAAICLPFVIKLVG